jgi:ribosomal protein S18 acetylase RimI-like enzyme
MTSEDVAAGLRICRVAGWNQLSRDWELFLKLSPNDCRVAVDSSGNVIGTVTTIRYENHFSWIGMLLVDPVWQGKGIGRNLLEQALEILSGEQTVKLDATPAGREVYLKYNFIDEYTISRMMMTETNSDFKSSHISSINESDFPALLKLDGKVFGADRRTVLNWIWNAGQKFSYIAKNGNEIVGYCFGRTGHLYTHIGPVVAQDENVAQQLVSAVLKNISNRPIILDVPHNKPGWMAWLQSIGFREQRILTRMYRGENSHPGLPEKQFAILGPEFG